MEKSTTTFSSLNNFRSGHTTFLFAYNFFKSPSLPAPISRANTHSASCPFVSRKIMSVSMLAILIIVMAAPASARTLYAISTTGGSWNANGSWSLLGIGGITCLCTPLATDDIVIPAGYSINIPASATPTCVSLTLNSNLILSASSAVLSLTDNTSSLTINGDLTMEGDTLLNLSGTAEHTIHLNGGAVTVNGNLAMTGSLDGADEHSQVIDLGTGGTLTVTGNITMNNDGATVEVRMNYTNSTINIGGAFSFADTNCKVVNGTGSNGTINYNGSGNQAVLSSTDISYYNLAVSNAGTKTPAGTLVINNMLSIHDSVILDAGTTTVGSGTAAFVMTGGEIKIAKVAPVVVPEMSGAYSLTGGKVTLNSTVAAQILRDKTYYNVEINNPFATAPQVTLNGNVTVNGVLTLTSGLISLVNNNLTIGSSGSITGYAAPGLVSTKYIITDGSGGLIQNNIGPGAKSGNVFFPVGQSISSYTPATIINAGTVDNFTVNVSDNVYLTPPSTGLLSSGFINKTFNVAEAIPGGSDVTMTLQWNTAEEQTSFDRTACAITHYASCWTCIQSSGTASSPGPHYRTTNGVTSFSPFTIETTVPLPIQLLSFNVFESEEEVGIAWKTGVEVNNDYFTVQRSPDNKVFEDILQIKGAGNSTQTQSYTVTDKTPLEGVSYYKLRQTDINGNTTFSDLKSINIKKHPGIGFNLYPNPCSGKDIYLMSNCVVEDNKEVLVVIYDALGNKTYSKIIPAANGSFFTVIDTSEKIPPGVYYVVSSTETQIHKQKLVIK